MSVLVYTAIIQYNKVLKRDTPRLTHQISGCRYVLFTNLPEAEFSVEDANGWPEIVRVTPTDADLAAIFPTVLAKRIKWTVWDFIDVAPYTMVVWIDAVHTLLSVPSLGATRLPLATLPHPARRCIYEECSEVYKKARDSLYNVDVVRMDLVFASMPKDYGLPETRIVAFDPASAAVRDIGRAIRDRTATTSPRDQLAFTLVLYQRKYTMDDITLIPAATHVLQTGKSGHRNYRAIPVPPSVSIAKLVTRNPGQLSVTEYSAIFAMLGGDAKFVSFSTGRDVPLWLSTRCATTTFLDHDKHFCQKTREAFPSACVHEVKYWTTVSMLPVISAPEFNTSKLDMDLPADVRDKDWTVVFVDGPTGYNVDCPGRFQSIWEAAKISSAQHVFVHDCDRPVEQWACQTFLSPRFTTCTKIGRLWHYHM
jgi:hypothetical protein